MKKQCIYIIGGFVYFMQGMVAYGADAASSPPQSISTGMILEMLFALVCIAGLIFLAIWLIRRLGSRMHSGRSGQKVKIRIQSIFNLGSRERLVVIKIDGHRLLLGVTTSSITLIKELPADTTDNEGESTSVNASDSRLFRQFLKKPEKS